MMQTQNVAICKYDCFSTPAGHPPLDSTTLVWIVELEQAIHDNYIYLYSFSYFILNSDKGLKRNCHPNFQYIKIRIS